MENFKCHYYFQLKKMTTGFKYCKIMFPGFYPAALPYKSAGKPTYRAAGNKKSLQKLIQRLFNL